MKAAGPASCEADRVRRRGGGEVRHHPRRPMLTRDPETQILYVQLPVRNTKDRQMIIDYRVKFFDRNGQVISQTQWQDKVLEPMVHDAIECNSSSALAADFQIGSADGEVKRFWILDFDCGPGLRALRRGQVADRGREPTDGSLWVFFVGETSCRVGGLEG